MNADIFSRRGFLQSSAVAMAAGSVLTGAGSVMSQPFSSNLAMAAEDGLKGRMWKTLKIGMVNVPGSLTEKFKVVKAAASTGSK